MVRLRIMRGRCGAALLAGVAMAGLIGCGGGVKTSPVQGKVVYADGQPVQGGSVTFNNAEKHISATGDIQKDGTFRLSFGELQGAPPGEYKVTVSGGSDTYGAPPTVAPKFGDPLQTPLKVTVKEGENSDVKLEVTRP